MPNPDPRQHYRIKGLHEASAETDPASSSPGTYSTEPGKLMGQVFRCLRRPHLKDHLYHCDNLNKLARCWPTFGFLQPRRHIKGWIKTAPLHLAPYIGWPRHNNPEPDLAKLLRVFDRQQDEQEVIQHLIAALETGDEPKVVEHPLAMGLACHLFGGSTWFRKNRDRIRAVVLRSPVASYVALASGAFAGDTLPLIERLAANPRLVLELAQIPSLKQQLKEGWFAEVLTPRPLFHSLWLFMSNREKAAWKLLHHAAKSDPVAAGICLGLAPESSAATDWSRVACKSSEARYWSGKIWFTEHDDMRTFKHTVATVSHLKNDPRWLYHWSRDLEWQDVNARVEEIWPNPWAIELIVDRSVSKDLVLDLYNKQKLDPENPVEGAIILWAIDYLEL